MKIFKKKISYSNLRLLTLSCLLFFSFYFNSQDFSYSSDKFFSDEENNSLIFEGNVNLNYDVKITEPDVSPIQLQGPKSKEIMIKIFGEEISLIFSFKYKISPS